jgi:CspA family cold shock protein
MSRGRVKWFSPEKGFGFIVDDRDNQIFVHFSEIKGDGFRMLHDGEEVEYEVSDTKRGLQAKNVVRLGLNNGDSSHTRP